MVVDVLVDVVVDVVVLVVVPVGGVEAGLAVAELPRCCKAVLHEQLERPIDGGVANPRRGTADLFEQLLHADMSAEFEEPGNDDIALLGRLESRGAKARVKPVEYLLLAEHLRHRATSGKIGLVWGTTRTPRLQADGVDAVPTLW